MASLPERDPNSKELLAETIRASVKKRGLSPAAAARLAGEPATRMLLLLSGKLFSFTERQLIRIRDKVAE